MFIILSVTILTVILQNTGSVLLSLSSMTSQAVSRGHTVDSLHIGDVWLVRQMFQIHTLCVVTEVANLKIRSVQLFIIV